MFSIEQELNLHISKQFFSISRDINKSYIKSFIEKLDINNCPTSRLILQMTSILADNKKLNCAGNLYDKNIDMIDAFKIA